MMKKSAQCWTAPDRITATSIIHGIGPQKYPRNFSSGFVLYSTISFGPYVVSRAVASAWLRPSGEVPSCFSTSDMGIDLRSFFWSVVVAGFESVELDRLAPAVMAGTHLPVVGCLYCA